MRSDVNQAYLRAYVKSRASSQPNNSSESSKQNLEETTTPEISSNKVVHETIRRIDQPASVLPPISKRVAQPIRAEQLATSDSRSDSDRRISGNPQSVWSPIGAERAMKATSTQNGEPARVANANTLPAENDPQHFSASRSSFNPSSNAEEPSKLRFDRQHIAPEQSRANRQTSPSESSSSLPPASVKINERIAREGRNSSSHELGHHPSELGRSLHSGAVRTVHAPHQQPSPDPISKATATTARLQPTGTVSEPVSPLSHSISVSTATRLPNPTTKAQGTSSLEPKPLKSNMPPMAKETKIPLAVSFSPSWEVDKFFWPEVVTHIEKAHPSAFTEIGYHLKLANQDGLKVMAITSGERGVGRSTIAMHMARCAAAQGLKVALIDTDAFYPSLVDQLRLDMQHGWQDCLFENVPLEEVAVKSVDDEITVFPLTSVISQQQLHANLHRMSKIVKRISTAFDIVFLDSCRLNLDQRDLIGVAQESIVDAAVVVVDTELSIKEKVDSAVSILQGMGIESIGLVENFHG